MADFDLRGAFASMQNTMTNYLVTNREFVSHPGTKGDVTEDSWRNWLSEYLPKRYCVDKAFIVDSNRKLSDQIDLVIYDRQYSPFVFKMGGAMYIPAESVYAVFEVKQTMNKKYLDYTANKIKSVRLLHRTNAPIYHADGCITDPRKPFTILGGLLCLDSEWEDTFGEPFVKAIDSYESYGRLDIGCVLQKGTFNLEYRKEENHKREFSTKEEALIYFFLKLLARLQRLGTVPAIEIEEYARVLSSL
ncbi:hypothetical protein GCM10023172_01750 [Hymenobacter ginsengisoli]|uniref:DUF6602 domain-containing protein n=1 Tax=Hymenobacter ginsengisoli TaxID=1051626 RepID=A0ABP8PY99_9BACT|nr:MULTISPECIES: DUF6602 domain-containing protein [unclassified Hymenobacter]MBO2033570.1 hypothetical protein [Hymenobacter sp. BT559]